MAFLVSVGTCESESMRTLISERHASRSVGLAEFWWPGKYYDWKLAQDWKRGVLCLGLSGLGN